MRSDRWPGPIRRVLKVRRRARFGFMLSHVETWPGMRVIDLGCGRNGRSTTDFAPESWEIVGVDLLASKHVAHRHPHFSYVRHDVADLAMFADGEFDLAISVGLLEHVTDPVVFGRTVAEVRRVARQYALVVPYRYCWLEPHFLVPLFPLLPQAVQNRLVRTFNLHGYGRAVRKDAGFIARRVRWRTNAEYRAAFPGARTRLTRTLDSVLIVKALDVA